ncbi:hypothetical protein HG535_0H03980 [Zygotorulaspora mrakii]|uniref:Mating factor alpha precursor N-terminal domain-containing protein n=1 Tax=Zygotorulaspora mrakii TaxID=42260 RepID=A0A7H9B8I1_ZYGMR|nr:uncharacterized protein HG535_0H03980 [Zygotorulaspora mrakii]QLG75071.1 hypothetical protein HG535_0H03980 [Zygotorulaspora mrakii]
MLLSSILSIALLFVPALATPVEAAQDTMDLPQEAILGFLDLGKDEDVAIVPFSNSTSTGLLFVNTTIAENAAAETDLGKRDAWHWIRLSRGAPIFKREAEADAWHWIRLGRGAPIFKREAEADAWHWIRLGRGAPIFKRDADADAEPWHWIQLGKGAPIF